MGLKTHTVFNKTPLFSVQFPGLENYKMVSSQIEANRGNVAKSMLIPSLFGIAIKLSPLKKA